MSIHQDHPCNAAKSAPRWRGDAPTCALCGESMPLSRSSFRSLALIAPSPTDDATSLVGLICQDCRDDSQLTALPQNKMGENS